MSSNPAAIAQSYLVARWLVDPRVGRSEGAAEGDSAGGELGRGCRRGPSDFNRIDAGCACGRKTPGGRQGTDHSRGRSHRLADPWPYLRRTALLAARPD